MSSTALKPPAAPPAATPGADAGAGPGADTGDSTGVVAVLAAAVDALAAQDVAGLPDAGLAATLLGVRAQIGRLEALAARLLATADGRGLAGAAGAPSTAAWYRTAAQLGAAEASTQVRHARALQQDLPRLAQAGVDGQICWAKVRAAAAAAAATPEHLLAEIEGVLAQAAPGLSVGRFDQLLRTARDRAEALLGTDPDSRAYQARYLRVSPVGPIVRIESLSSFLCKRVGICG